MNFGGMGVISPKNLLLDVRAEIRTPVPVSASEKIVLEFEIRVAHSVLSRERGGFYIGLQLMFRNQRPM